jgi:hypothetical protein
MESLQEIDDFIQRFDEEISAYMKSSSRIKTIEFSGIKPHTEMTIYTENGEILGICNAWKDLPKEITDSLSMVHRYYIKCATYEMRKITTTNEKYRDGITAVFNY